MTSGRPRSLFIATALSLLAPSCHRSFVTAKPELDHYVQIGKMTCYRPADIAESEKLIEHEASVGIHTAAISGSVDSGLRKFGKTLYYNGRTELVKEFIICSAIGNGYITMEQARELRVGFANALEDERTIENEYDKRDREATVQQMADAIARNKERVQPIAPAPKCNEKVVGVVRHLLTACENERRVCPDKPLPPRMTVEEYESIIAALPIYPVFFESGQDEVTDSQKRELFNVSQSAITPDTTVLLIGRASRSGKSLMNRALARRRAQHVRNHLETATAAGTKYELFSYGENTLYMNPNGLLGRRFADKYRNIDHLNQSVWVVLYDC